MAFSMAMPFSEGEEEMHRLLRVPNQDNPTSAMLTPQAAFSLQRVPLLAVGAVDAEGRPWVTVWGGEPGFSRPLSQTIVGTKTFVDRVHDPVVQTLVGGRPDGEVVQEQGKGQMVASLTIDLMTRKRVKLYGRMVAGALSRADEIDSDDEDAKEGPKPSNQGQIQLVVNIEQSLGNCPKYLNKKVIKPAPVQSESLSESPQLSTDAIKLINDADLFFISSSCADADMDANHRGGPVGFVRVLSNGSDGAELVWPEYSGNRLYQTLGNLRTTPKAGLAIPNFVTGDVLYVTGTTEILLKEEAAKILPHSNLIVKLKITAAKHVRKGLPFRGVPEEPSPYNPLLRLLASEGNIGAQIDSGTPANTATLVEKTTITPTINRYRFKTSSPISYESGQWAAFDFSEELSIGYRHMDESDPTSLNDDFIRTFTISSPSPGKSTDEFQITIRRGGPVTTFLNQQSGRAGLAVPLRGIGGDFSIPPPEKTTEIIPFIAGGVGITPLISQLPKLPISQVRLLWTIRADDLGFVTDSFASYADLGYQTTLFVTSATEGEQSERYKQPLDSMKEQGAKVFWRRMQREDLEGLEDANSWYLCAGTSLQGTLLDWLDGRKTVYESFNY